MQVDFKHVPLVPPNQKSTIVIFANKLCIFIGAIAWQILFYKKVQEKMANYPKMIKCSYYWALPGSSIAEKVPNSKLHQVKYVVIGALALAI